MIFARENNAQPVIAKLDCLARDVEFIFQLKNSGVDFKALDLPDMTTLTIGIYATMAQNTNAKSSRNARNMLYKRKRDVEKNLVTHNISCYGCWNYRLLLALERIM
ncbi:hypothetical protein [Candidatus Uabimicrobium sp. HlEnr_7]|uniref:hypothetical protein n=1 Tax=Candidatus Uabimicrobium helgolandensis TaxID=3095367 RepID=UPI003555C3CC